MEDYERFKIKVYDNWDLYLHTAQIPYLGRAYAWAKRGEANLISDMSSTERDELFGLVIPGWEAAVSKLFQHDRTNLACLGNTSPHLHWHLIPRYNSPRKFGGVEFIDPNPRGNYAPYPKIELAEEILFEIKDNILKDL